MMPLLRAVILMLSAALAGGLGFTLGSGSPGGSPQATPGAASETLKLSGKKELTGLAAILHAPDEPTRLAQFLGALRTNNVPALLDLLRYVSTPGVLSPGAKALYVEAIVDRVLELGGAESLLEMRGLRGEDSDLLVGLVVKALVQHDPDAAEKLVLARQGRERDVALMALARALGETDPATEALYKEWAGTDSASASERLDTLPAGKLRDRSIVGFAYSSSPYDPDSVAVWAASIEDSGLRKRALRNLAYNWREKDRSAARAFAGTISEPELRENILRIVNEKD